MRNRAEERKVRTYGGVRYYATTVTMPARSNQEIRASAKARGLGNKKVLEQAYEEYLTEPGMAEPSYCRLRTRKGNQHFGGEIRADLWDRMAKLADSVQHPVADLERSALLRWGAKYPAPGKVQILVAGSDGGFPAVYHYCPHCGKPLPTR